MIAKKFSPRAGGLPAPAGTFCRLDPEHTRTVTNNGDDVADVLIVSAPRTSGYVDMGWA